VRICAGRLRVGSVGWMEYAKAVPINDNSQIQMACVIICRLTYIFRPTLTGGYSIVKGGVFQYTVILHIQSY
jgi:hypothetical protein